MLYIILSNLNFFYHRLDLLNDISFFSNENKILFELIKQSLKNGDYDNINIDKNFISDQNKLYKQQVINDFENCSSIFFKSNSINIDKIFEKLNNLNIVLPSWGFGVGGTRFAKFPIMGEPTNVFEKIQDCSIVSNLLGNGSKISLHFPWDKVRDINELLDFAKNYNITFDAVNSNTFQDNLNQEYSYKFGSLSSIEKNVREQAVEHNIECINIGNNKIAY